MVKADGVAEHWPPSEEHPVVVVLELQLLQGATNVGACFATVTELSGMAARLLTATKRLQLHLVYVRTLAATCLKQRSASPNCSKHTHRETAANLFVL